MKKLLLIMVFSYGVAPFYAMGVDGETIEATIDDSLISMPEPIDELSMDDGANIDSDTMNIPLDEPVDTIVDSMSKSIARINNESKYDIKQLRIKVKINGKKGSILVPTLAAGSEIIVDLLGATTKKGESIVDGDEIKSIEVLKIRPKICINPYTQFSAKCRGRLKPDDKMQRDFIIVDEEDGVVKISRSRDRGKTKAPFIPEPRLVRVKHD